MTSPDPEPTTIPALPPERIGAADFVALVAHIAETRPAEALEPGAIGSFHREYIRFRHSPSLAFCGADVLTVETNKDDLTRVPGSTTVTVIATFLGLLGTATPLPAHFAAAATEEDPEEPAFTELCDVFHHRLYALFYHTTLRLDILRGLTGAERSKWAERLLGLAGMSDPNERRALDLARIFVYRGRRGARTLILVLRRELSVWLGDARLGLREAAATDLVCGDDERTCLGRACTTLGRDLLLGATFRGRGTGFAITIHDLDGDGFAACLPGGEANERLHALIRDHHADAFDYAIELHPRPGQRPTCQLGARYPGARLGLGTWLRGQPNPVAPLLLHRSRPR